MWLPLLLLGLLQPLLGYQIDRNKLDGKLARARVELNRLKEVKAFVTEDIPLYHNLEMKHIPGADPELVLLNEKYEEIDRIGLSNMRRKEINQLLKDLRFYQKDSPDAPVPPEFQMAPGSPKTPDQAEGKHMVEDTKEEL
ncbi:hypothetical protein GDO81_001974 [Engystomops pustulosus]|uniref:Selenoprotein M n=1 Tax=Engystomops pustulosus TaxID=76066 RepID=A0AAV7DHW6_ENGPU|nr:hypothetical protein GDO81_001974 [Engystomops pustulosus]